MFRPLQSAMDNRKNHMDKIQTDTVDAIKELESLTQKLKVQESEAIIWTDFLAPHLTWLPGYDKNLASLSTKFSRNCKRFQRNHKPTANENNIYFWKH